LVELRRYQRTPVDLAVEFAATPAKGGGSPERSGGRATDISLGGMYIQTKQPLAFRAELVVYLPLQPPPSSGSKAGKAGKTPLALPAVVRWVRPGEGMGVQFGLIGARETHAITELTKAP
jgi:type IV pilus assembly protein PilZ